MDILAEGFDWKSDWNVATRYKINDLVRYGATTYVCNTGLESFHCPDGLVDQSGGTFLTP